jgi:hypothetical protein
MHILPDAKDADICFNQCIVPGDHWQRIETDRLEDASCTSQSTAQSDALLLFFRSIIN